MEKITASVSQGASSSLTRPSTKRSISKIRQAAVLSRWDSVRDEKEKWLDPFHKLPIDRALVYLDDLRKVVIAASDIINARINNPKNGMKCETCGKDLSAVRSDGRVSYMAVKFLKNERKPELSRNAYWCSELCNNKWVHKHFGAMGGDGR